LAQAITPAQPKYKNVGPEPQRFAVAEGALGNVATASVPTLLRLGAGAFCIGYDAKMVEVSQNRQATRQHPMLELAKGEAYHSTTSREWVLLSSYQVGWHA